MPKAKYGRHLKFSDLSNPWQRFRSMMAMSQRDLAKILELGQSTVSQYESGARFPDPVPAKRFVILCRARRVRCSMDEVYEKLDVD